MDDVLAKCKRYLAQGDDLTVITLKGHLLIEEELGSIIAGFLPNPQATRKANLTFYTKTVLAQAICWRRPEDEMWSLIFAINSLRNDLAYRLESEKREGRFDEVLRQHAKMSVGDPDCATIARCTQKEQLILAITHVLGFLRQFRQDVEQTCDFWHAALRRQGILLNELTFDTTKKDS